MARPIPRIALMRPLLPCADELVPYLRRIDANRWYTNFGPLAREFEHALAGHFKLAEGGAVTTANGTLGLILALGRRRRVQERFLKSRHAPLPPLAREVRAYLSARY